MRASLLALGWLLGGPLAMVVTCSEMRALEERAFAQGISAGALMDEAGAQIAAAVRQFFPVPGLCVAHFGKGHNGGDALVAARHLARAGWAIELRPVFERAAWSALTEKNFMALAETGPNHGAQAAGRGVCVVLDGLLGIGAGGALREPIRGVTRAINALRQSGAAHVFALDVPTGIDGDSGQADPDAVRADFTLTIGFAKTGLLADCATPFVGRLTVLPLRELSARAEPATISGKALVSTAESLRALLPGRAFDVHKGGFGRVAVVAGSRGFLGAALLASHACVRAGAGLVSLYVGEDIYPIAATAARPEVMVQPVASLREVLAARKDVVALGPGLGSGRSGEVLELIAAVSEPMVLDADGLNAAARQPGILETCAGPRLLTPHPGEMARLDAGSAQRSRARTVEAFSGRFAHVLLLKGARTVIGQRGRALAYNSTGSPGMASGGMGDVLTGVCAALAGQGLELYDAARLGAWICGRAAELAIEPGGQSEESLCATDVLAHLGAAFRELRAGCF